MESYEDINYFVKGGGNRRELVLVHGTSNDDKRILEVILYSASKTMTDPSVKVLNITEVFYDGSKYSEKEIGKLVRGVLALPQKQVEPAYLQQIPRVNVPSRYRAPLSERLHGKQVRYSRQSS